MTWAGPTVECWFVMRQPKWLILGIACVISLPFCALFGLHSRGFVRPVGVGWGDPVRAHGYEVWAEGLSGFRAASGFVKVPPPGHYAYEVQSMREFDPPGIHCQHWNMTAGEKPQAPILGRFTELS